MGEYALAMPRMRADALPLLIILARSDCKLAKSARSGKSAFRTCGHNACLWNRGLRALLATESSEGERTNSLDVRKLLTLPALKVAHAHEARTPIRRRRSYRLRRWGGWVPERDCG
jgi:hypothetical protein